VLETSHPPVYYIPSDIKMEHLVLMPHSSWCEWKGRAAYYKVVVGDKQVQAAWFTDPTGLASIKDYVAFTRI